MLAETDPLLFDKWMAAYEYEPWGDERLDLAIGKIIEYNQAAHGNTPKAPQEYMPYLKNPEEKQQTESELKASWNAVCRTMGEE